LAGYLLASAWFVISIPTLHLLWVIASFFWDLRDQHHQELRCQFHVRDHDLRRVLFGTAMSQPKRMSKIRCGSVWHPRLESWFTVGIEILFSRIKPGEDIVAGVADRLAAVQAVSVFCEDCPVDQLNASKRSAPGHGGTSYVAADLTTVCYTPNYAEQMGQ